MALNSALQQLANYRSHNSRASQEVVRLGLPLLENNPVSKLGDKAWQPLEQLALAALDVGNIQVAQKCVRILLDRFPGSPRVEALAGILIEGTKSPQAALEYYKAALTDDSPNPAIWKRMVSVLITMKQTDAAIKELSEYLDTFYSDIEAWLELSDIYLSHNQYSTALQSLSHVLLLSPQNPFYFLQFAETAYTANDLPLALKMFLVVTEMCDSISDVTTKTAPEGISSRAWWGVKLATRRLLTDPRASASTSSMNTPKYLQELEALATERVLALYGGNKAASCRDVVVKWMEQRG